MEELAFTLDSEHYKDESGNSHETSYIPFKDLSSMNLVRHKTALIVKSSSYYRVFPRDYVNDPGILEDVKACMRFELEDPRKEFRDTKESVVSGALASGMWAFTIGYNPNVGIDGTIVIDALRPDKLFWHNSYQSPQRIDCPWTIIEYDLPADDVKRRGAKTVPEAFRWKDVKDLQPDGTAGERGKPNTDGANFETAPPQDGSSQLGTVKVLFCYEQFVTETVRKVRPDSVTLEPSQRYMACGTCGYSEKGAAIDGSILPEMGGECPECLQVLKRTDEEMISDDILRYRDGRRLVIYAPNQARTFYDGEWPFDLAGFPVVVFKAYNHPIKRRPHSETFYVWTNQQMVNALYRMGYDQMRKAHLIIVAPEDALKDAKGEPFGYSDYRDAAYYDQSEVQGPPSQWLHAFQPPGLNAAWPTFLNAVQGSFAVNKGTTDLGLTPTQSRDIPVGTIDAMIKTGEIPVDHQIARFQEVLSILYGLLVDMIRSTWTEAKAVRVMGPDGQLILRKIRGEALPGVDIVVTAEPDMSMLREMDVQEMAAIIQLPPPARRMVAKMKGIDSNTLEQYEADEKMYQAQQMMLQQEMEQQAAVQNGSGNGNGNGMATGSPPAMSQAAMI